MRHDGTDDIRPQRYAGEQLLVESGYVRSWYFLTRSGAYDAVKLASGLHAFFFPVMAGLVAILVTTPTITGRKSMKS